MIVDRVLRAKARQLIESGRVPSRLPARRWGGPGSGTSCMLCGASVKDEEVGFEIEFGCNGTGVSNHELHVHCLEALELELREFEPGGGRVSAGAQLQPLGAATPEGREVDGPS